MEVSRREMTREMTHNFIYDLLHLVVAPRILCRTFLNMRCPGEEQRNLEHLWYFVPK